ncbi:MAG: hypothetical protein JSR66_17490 [Proteobacteria bacterium]|nr:hypothetical protein [Pseudomonadota bacterium]
MRQILDLIARICASGPRASLRGSAEAALAAMATEFNLTAVLFEPDAAQLQTVRVTCGANIPTDWQRGGVPLANVPFVGQALDAPERVIVTTMGAVEIVCGAVSSGQEARYSIALIGGSQADIGSRADAVDVVRKMLAWTLPSASSVDTGVFAAIVEAKHEWENAADVFPELIGLINRSRRVVRINRAIERWSLGKVQDAIGLDLHEMLHPLCQSPRCDLDRLLENAFRKLGPEPSAAFEVADAVSGRDLLIVLNTTTQAFDAAGSSGWVNAAFVVSNVTAARHAERELKSLNQALEQRIADRTERITEINRTLMLEVGRRRAAQELLRDSKSELEALSLRLVTAQEEERKRISQDLHDSVGQEMSAVKYSLERATLLIQRNDTPQAIEVIKTAIVRTKEVIDEVRAIAMNLRPCALDHLGVVSAIRSLYRRWSGVYGSIAVTEDINVTDQDIPNSIATHLYRAVQEILSNVARHAQARRVLISLRSEDGNLIVSIQDDGVGFQLDACDSSGPSALGLLGLRARTEQSGGTCRVTTAPGKGTTVRLKWPLTLPDLRNARLRLN